MTDSESSAQLFALILMLSEVSGDQRSFLINFNLKPLNFHQIKV